MGEIAKRTEKGLAFLRNVHGVIALGALALAAVIPPLIIVAEVEAVSTAGHEVARRFVDNSNKDKQKTPT